MNLKYHWSVDGAEHWLEMVCVEGTHGRSFLFGEDRRAIAFPHFYIGTVPVSQALWSHVMGAGNNRSRFRGDR